MNYKLVYHPEVKKDIKTLNKKQKDTVRKAIETRLLTEPEKYGKPLRKSLMNYRKLRVGDVRVVFKITGPEILILAILHRKKVYETAGKRIIT